MGRKRLNLELKLNDKSRITTFKKRKQVLVRKMHELATLCDVKACMIIYGPEQENGPEILLENCDEVHEMIDSYKAKKEKNNTFGLNDYFLERKRKIEDDLLKLRKKNREAKFPTELAGVDSMTEGQLRHFAAMLSNKLEYVKSRIEILKISSANNLMYFGNTMLNGQFCPPPAPHQQLHPIDQNSMMMLLTNGGDQLGGAVVDPYANIPEATLSSFVASEPYLPEMMSYSSNLDCSFVASEPCVPETMSSSSCSVNGDLNFLNDQMGGFIDVADYFVPETMSSSSCGVNGDLKFLNDQMGGFIDVADYFSTQDYVML